MHHCNALSNETRLGVGLVVFVTLSLSGCKNECCVPEPAGVELQSIAVTSPSATILAGTTAQLTATGTFRNGASQNFTSYSTVAWTSGTPSAATVTTSGLVAGIGMGSSVITATARDGSGISGSTTLTVWSVTSVSVAPAAATLIPGGQLQLVATVTAGTGTPTTVTWSSSDISKASVSASGFVTAIVVTPGVAICATSTADVTEAACMTLTISPPICSPCSSPPDSQWSVGGEASAVTSRSAKISGSKVFGEG